MEERQKKLRHRYQNLILVSVANTETRFRSYTTTILYNFLPLQTLAVDKWNTDSVEEFLSIYLVKDGDEISEETEEVLAQP